MNFKLQDEPEVPDVMPENPEEPLAEPETAQEELPAEPSV
jgi:hypothetical protein